MPAPANDDFANATVISGASGTAGPVTVDDATSEVGEPAGSALTNGANQTIWFEWTAPANGLASFDTDGSTAGTPDADTTLTVWTGATLGTLVEVASNDDAIGLNSAVAFAAVAGTVYKIQAGTYAPGSIGDITLNWGVTGPPANDNYANAEVIAGASGMVLGTTIEATGDWAPPHGGDPTPNVWYRWTAPDDGELSISLSGLFSGDWLAYTGTTLGGSVEVGHGGLSSFHVTKGTTYHITVYPFGAEETFGLYWALAITPTQVFGGTRFYEAPLWRMIVSDLDDNILTFLDKLAIDRSVTVTRAAARVISGRVPSDNPEINIPAPNSAGEPFLSEGIRLVSCFRREGRTGSHDAPWQIRARGLILDLDDSADADHATSTFTAYDPWKYLYRRPVLLADGTLPGDQGRVYPAGTRANEIIIDQFSIAEAIGGTIFTDYASTGFYAGTIETCDPLPDGGDGIAVRFPAGTTLGEMLDTLVATGTCDVVFDPIYDTANRPGILCELSIYQSAGTFRADAVMGWDRWPRNVVQLSRQVAGSERANRIKMYAGQGGPPVPLQEDAISIATFGEYWATQYLPGAASIAAARTIAERQLALLKDGQYTYALSPAAERAPLVFQEYREADTLPLYASERFRDPISGVPLRVESIPIVIGDDQLERINQILVSFAPETGS